ncbi:alkaline phosphatase family protein [Solwaraspora sp. WMMD406]|nr:nucleotide pyrophosphatase/phosphodiesterase family protein [Solwaraspora sp. WMMD406]MDG4765315.1 alkaline phosphatase family protein [Solwaraspora sp. WMMD406]
MMVEADLLRPARPEYGEASLADVLPSALAVLGVPGAVDVLGLTGPLAGVRRLVVLLVDGLGWHQLPAAGRVAPALARLAAAPTARRLTTGFPSTTPTSLVSLGTGVAPGAHGVLGFRTAVPGTDRVLNHIEWRDDPDPLRWQPVPTQLQRAEAAGVAVTVVSRPEYAGSGLTVAANRGGVYRGAVDVDQLATELLTVVAAGDGPVLVSGYHPDLDRRGHRFGVESEPWLAAVVELDRLVGRLVAGLPADAALLVTADHGQLNVPAEPDYRFDLDTDPRLRAGVRLVAGEPRVRYLHTLPGATDDVVAAWRSVLGPAAWVARRAELVEAGWFGPVPADHLPRIGDVVVVCQERFVVVATETDPVGSSLIGFHGGVTEMELSIPLLVATTG